MPTGSAASASRTSRPDPVRCDVTWAASKPAPRWSRTGSCSEHLGPHRAEAPVVTYSPGPEAGEAHRSGERLVIVAGHPRLDAGKGGRRPHPGSQRPMEAEHRLAG